MPRSGSPRWRPRLLCLAALAAVASSTRRAPLDPRGHDDPFAARRPSGATALALRHRLGRGRDGKDGNRRVGDALVGLEEDWHKVERELDTRLGEMSVSTHPRELGPVEHGEDPGGRPPRTASRLDTTLRLLDMGWADVERELDDFLHEMDYRGPPSLGGTDSSEESSQGDDSSEGDRPLEEEGEDDRGLAEIKQEGWRIERELDRHLYEIWAWPSAEFETSEDDEDEDDGLRMEMSGIAEESGDEAEGAADDPLRSVEAERRRVEQELDERLGELSSLDGEELAAEADDEEEDDGLRAEMATLPQEGLPRR